MEREFINNELNKSQLYSQNNKVDWVQSGNSYFDRLEELIDESKSEIHFQTYIFISDETGLKISNALIRAARRNVKIFLLLDAFGSQALDAEKIIEMTEAGIQMRKFGVLYSKGSFHIGRRMHHKVIVIDGIISIVGGINVSNNYNDINNNNAWLDFAAIMKGEVSKQLLSLCRKRWDRWNIRSRKKTEIKNTSSKSEYGKSRIAVRRNDFVRIRMILPLLTGIFSALLKNQLWLLVVISFLVV
jgi:cardiolipin synthase